MIQWLQGSQETDENLCIKKRKLKEIVLISRRTVSRQAPSIEKMFHANQLFPGFRQPFLPSQTCCHHQSRHRCLKSEAISHGQNDMDKCDIHLLTLLFRLGLYSGNKRPDSFSSRIHD